MRYCYYKVLSWASYVFISCFLFSNIESDFDGPSTSMHDQHLMTDFFHQKGDLKKTNAKSKRKSSVSPFLLKKIKQAAKCRCTVFSE